MDTMFTVEESNLICIFAGEGRNEVIEDMERALPYLEDTDMEELATLISNGINRALHTNVQFS